MNQLRFIVVLTLLCNITTTMTVHGDNLFFGHIDTNDGLSQNTVYSIVQDKQDFLWFATKDGLNRYDGVSCLVFNRNNSGLGDNYVNTLWLDKAGCLWAGTEHGVYVYDPTTESFSPLTACVESTDRLLKGSVRCISSDAQGYVCIGSSDEGLLRLDSASNVLRPAYREIQGQEVSFLSCVDGVMWVGVAGVNLFYAEGSSGRLKAFVDDEGHSPFLNAGTNGLLFAGTDAYVATDKGLYRFDQASHRTELLERGFFRTVCLAADGHTLWAGSEQGIYIYDIYKGEMTHVTQPDIDDPFSLADNAIYSLFTDREGSMWIGSYFGGVNYLPALKMRFQNFYPRQGQTFMGHRVREFCQDNDGIVWIGTEDKGLLRYTPSDGSLRPMATHLPSMNIHGLCADGDTLWVGVFDGGLERIDLRSMSYKIYQADGRKGSIISNFIFNICRASDGTLWMGTPAGLMRYDRVSDSFSREERVPGVFVQHIIESHDGLLWLATYSDGLYSYDRRTGNVHHFAYAEGREGTIGGSKVIGLFEDSRHQLWVMTHEGGLSMLDRQTGFFKPYAFDENGRFNLVYRMVEDRRGNLWCSSNNGLIQFNPSTDARIVYTSANGLHSDHFNYQSGFMDRSGYIYFGTVNGFVRFHPNVVDNGTHDARIAFSRLYIFNRLQQPLADGSPLVVSIDQTTRLRLNHHQTSFAIEPRLLSFSNPGTVELHYRLEGYDHGWLPLNSSNPSISYANLPYGHYTLHVGAIFNDGTNHEIERTLSIDIIPPFYLSTIAKFIYILLFLAILGLLWQYFQRKQQLRLLRTHQRMEQQKERELYDSKIAFFTSIAHEIRTPLTLIKTPLESILRRNDLSDDLRQELNIMETNSSRLINLVNQLLDFQKVESQTLQLHPQELCLSDWLAMQVQLFRPAIEQRGLQLQTHIAPGINIVADHDLVGKMLANLMSNALKYAETYINISLTADDSHVTITTVNDGDIVPLACRESIFRPFVRYTSTSENAATAVTGTGIGLSLLRTLAEQHHGSVCMDRDETVNRFILTLPRYELETEETDAAEAGREASDSTDIEAAQMPLPVSTQSTLLIVEDNADLRKFIARHLETNYSTVEARDGVEALEKLHEHSISIIISDVMMPRMDGISLLTEVKQDIEFSHIPVVLLTAKTTIEDRLAGLRQGADAYIDKPFDMELLEQTLQTLLLNQQRLYTSFFQRPKTHMIAKLSLSDVEADFVKKLSESVASHLENNEYGVDELAADMSMSRSKLTRKIRGVLNMSPNDYIRMERLKRSVALLKTGRYRINEVCYMVGFNTPSYFAKCFQMQYGILPKDLLETPESI